MADGKYICIKTVKQQRFKLEEIISEGWYAFLIKQKDKKRLIDVLDIL